MKAREWLGKAVSVHNGGDPRMEQWPMAKGEVIAVIDCPSLVVRSESGSVQTVPITLPMKELRLDPPGCGCTGCLVGESVPQAGERADMGPS